MPTATQKKVLELIMTAKIFQKESFTAFDITTEFRSIIDDESCMYHSESKDYVHEFMVEFLSKKLYTKKIQKFNNAKAYLYSPAPISFWKKLKNLFS